MREQPASKSLFIVWFKNLVFDLEAAGIFQMIENEGGEEASAPGSNDTDFQGPTRIFASVKTAFDGC